MKDGSGAAAAADEHGDLDGSPGRDRARRESPKPGSAAGSGLRFSTSSALVTRALDALDREPLSASELARKVLGIRRGPSDLAEHVLRELLGDEPRVSVGEDGVWSVAESEVPDPEGGLEGLDYVVVDVETTGTSPSRGDRVTEIAAVEVSGGEIVGEYSSLINPQRSIPRWISRLTGITEEMVADAPVFEEVADRVRERLEGRIFVAHNVPFDWRFVAEEMRRARSVLPVGPRLCTLRLARKALPGLRRKGLDSVTWHYGVEIEDRHRALGDALATTTVLMRLLEEVGRQGIRDWPELKRWLAGGRRPEGDLPPFDGCESEGRASSDADLRE